MNDITLSKKISYLLRHNPEDLKIDKHGWCSVDDLMKKLNINFVTLERIVATNNKKRFIFSENNNQIRANQGHSIKVDVQLKKAIPPTKLYHGTNPNFKKAIIKKGLLKMKRNHVHLSGDKETAIKVGKRHCKKHQDPFVFEIDTKKMVQDNIPFYLSENNVWLVEEVKPNYLN